MKKKIKAFIENDIVRRVAKTFVQAFLGVIVVVEIQDITSIDVVRTILIAGVSAGMSAVWNLAVLLIQQYIDK